MSLHAGTQYTSCHLKRAAAVMTGGASVAKI